jgi:hypothetical protein
LLLSKGTKRGGAGEGKEANLLAKLNGGTMMIGSEGAFTAEEPQDLMQSIGRKEADDVLLRKLCRSVVFDQIGRQESGSVCLFFWASNQNETYTT